MRGRPPHHPPESGIRIIALSDGGGGAKLGLVLLPLLLLLLPAANPRLAHRP